MMEKQAIINELNSRYMEELNDKKTYYEFAKELYDNGHCELAGVIKDIANEESTHAKLIKEMMEHLEK